MKNISQIIKYSVVGGISFVADFSVFFVAINFIEVDYLIAGMYSFLVGVFVNYILARKYVFYYHNKVKKTVEIIGVYVISGVGLLIHQVSIYIFVEFIVNDVYMSKILASIIVLLWNYNARRVYLYGEKLT